MVRVLFYSYIAVVFLQSCSCWIINDINPKMLAKSAHSKSNQDIKGTRLLKQISFIFPGTKWCGAGNIAENYDDLGFEREADICCRNHDNCPEVIAGGETKYNLTNDAFYSRLSCNCDNTFYNCLKAANTAVSNVLGNIYFNALQTKCYRKDYPVSKCVKRGGYLFTKCLEYSYDTSREQIYQWFDEENY